MTKVAPSILSGDFAALGLTVHNVQQWGADLVHVDVMDGLYVPNLTFGMPMVRALRPHTTLPLDVHLMIVEPERYVQQFCDCGADIVTFHPDASLDVQGALDAIHTCGARCGLALNPDRGIEWLAPYMSTVDIIVLMGVYPGFGGQQFIQSVVDKISAVRAMIDASGRDILLELDGGVTLDNARTLVQAGVDVLVGGQCVFGASDSAQAVATLQSIGR